MMYIYAIMYLPQLYTWMLPALTDQDLVILIKNITKQTLTSGGFTFCKHIILLQQKTAGDTVYVQHYV